MAADENFLARWSRRKRENTREGEARERAPEKPAVAPAAPAPAAPASAAPELPPVDSLRGLASEYKDFLDPGVDENLRRSALKKLFHDPHFNVMDGLDVYIDDYSKPDPVPESMLKELLARHRSFSERDPSEAKDATETPPAPAEERPAVADAGDAEPPAAVPHDPAVPAAEEKKPT